jgi:hypothetical protein
VMELEKPSFVAPAVTADERAAATVPLPHLPFYRGRNVA